MNSAAFQVHYTWERQRAFARLSGDHNPIHLDPLAARRTLAGSPVVHGVHLVLAGIEGILSAREEREKSPGAFASLSARFDKPVFVESEVSYQLTNPEAANWDIVAAVGGDIVCQARVEFGGALPPPAGDLPGLTGENLCDLGLEQLAGSTGSLPIGLDAPLAATLFPAIAARQEPRDLAGILALSRLVGMRCPGLHSLFSSIDLQFRGGGPANSISYRVAKVDQRFGRVTLQVESARLSGTLSAFLRPAPVAQASLAEISRQVEPGMFKDSVALIIGGSRGLGEITAKIIAAGGGRPIITYHRGQDDALRVRSEIEEAGHACPVLPFNVQGELDGLLEQLAQHPPVTSLYYFASTKIFGRRHGFFDYSLLQEFSDIYVSSFGRLIDALLASQPGRLRIFYPSSVAVDNGPQQIKEYAMAKRAGEDLCAFYNEHSGRVTILVERLPRLKTDQTQTLLPNPADDTLPCMLPIIRRVEAKP